MAGSLSTAIITGSVWCEMLYEESLPFCARELEGRKQLGVLPRQSSDHEIGRVIACWESSQLPFVGSEEVRDGGRIQDVKGFAKAIEGKNSGPDGIRPLLELFSLVVWWLMVLGFVQ